MARKQFVSSKKNAPSRAVSSKEAALHGRAGGAIGAERDDDDGDNDSNSDDNNSDDDASNSPGSPASSNGSSLLTSDDQDDATDELAGGGGASEAPVAVEVVPASVGRGKQLRFPTVISRGKESRVFGHGGDGDDDDDDDNDNDSDSDDDSLLSLASDEEDDDGGDKSSKHKAIGEEEDAAVAAPAYPIKALRARKRHRPDSGYYNQMSTYVRDCLLSVRDGADVLSEEAHDEFRRKLSAGTVERVVWKEAAPAAAEPPADSAKSEKKKRRKTETPTEQVKKEKPRKESRKSKAEPSSASKASSSNNSSSTSNIPTSSTITNSSSSSSTSVSTNTGNNSSSSSNGATVKVEAVKAPPSEPALCSSCKRKLSDVNEPEKPPPAPKKSVTIVMPEIKEESKPAMESKPTAPAEHRPASESGSRPAELEPQGTFLIPTVGGRDVRRLRAEADRLNEEARALKHEGNHKGKTEAGPAGQVAQGKFYLRSSAKFFQNALKLADLKAAYKDLGDEGHARRYGDFCVTTLTQTSSLIESTIRAFQAAGSKRMMALAYKLSSIVHLTIYRLQHTKLLMYYSDLFTPGRSPETRQNGTPTPPIAGATPDSREAAMRSYLLKEMEHTLRGFEMWRRYEACNVLVLPRISNPATTDLAVLFEELNSELGQA